MRTVRTRWWMVWGLILVSVIAGGTYHVLNEFIGRTLAVILAFVFALHVVGWLLTKSVVRPLEALSDAAHQIAEGELEFTIPESGVREVAEVRSAFQVMTDGLKSSLEREARLESERRFLLGAIAHDLRTPLFALRGYLEGLEHGVADTPEKQAKYIAVCRQKADQLDRLVADLFALTKLDLTEQPVAHEMVDWGQLVEASVEGIQPKASQKGVRISIKRQGSSTERVEFLGDGHLLQRALDNLLDNAVRHVPAGGFVEIVWEVQSEERLAFSILDNGLGFAEVDLEQVFEPLYRSETSRNRVTGGAGLGLSIARRILRLHGGDLQASNRESGGACLSGSLHFLQVRTSRVLL